MVRYAVGLDVGDGESSIAWVPADVPGERAQMFERTPGEVSVVTAYAQRNDDTWVIGDEALLADDVTRIQVNFKYRPTRSADGVAKPMLPPFFASLYWLEFEERHPDVANDCIIHVGCPAGWEEEQVAFYQGQLEAKLKPRIVAVVPESQSAFLYVHDSTDISPELRPILVVDVGSSTTDFTVVDNQPVNLGFGDGLGCRDIDEAMRAAIILSLSAPERELLQSSRSAGKFLLWLCRRWKEAAYAGGTPQRPEGRTEQQQLVLRTCWDALATFDVQGLVDRQWRPRLRRELVAVREHLGEQQPRLILTTGGGSRMSFVETLCHETFPSVDVNPAPEPSLAVALGLASYGRWCHRVNLFRTMVAALADSREIDDIVRRHATPLARRFYVSFFFRQMDVLYLPIADEVEAGADLAELVTNRALYRRFTSWMDTAKGAAVKNKVLGPLERDIKDALAPRAAELCREVGLDSTALAISINLSGGLSVKARQPWYDKYLEVGNKLGFTPLVRTRPGRAYLRKTQDFNRYMNPPLVAPAAFITSMAFKLDEEQVKDLTTAIRDEVRSQLVERVQPIERLLAT
jgi:hypothetical protein